MAIFQILNTFYAKGIKNPLFFVEINSISGLKVIIKIPE